MLLFHANCVAFWAAVSPTVEKNLLNYFATVASSLLQITLSRSLSGAMFSIIFQRDPGLFLCSRTSLRVCSFWALTNVVVTLLRALFPGVTCFNDEALKIVEDIWFNVYVLHVKDGEKTVRFCGHAGCELFRGAYFL